jgi:hypothetical protein
MGGVEINPRTRTDRVDERCWKVESEAAEEAKGHWWVD